jgi:putative DNA primase/helicase
MSDFLKYIDNHFMHLILPIIPAGAKLGEESSLTEGHLGKIPGHWSPRGIWYGLPKWQSHRSTQYTLKHWQEWQQPDKAGVEIAVGLRLGIVIAVDIDIDDTELAEYATILTVMTLGPPLAVRRREGGSPRRVLLYLHKPRTMPITKGRVAFQAPDITGDKVNAVEILGLGQQVVIEGPHASGAMHYWEDGRGLTDITVSDIREAKWLEIDDAISLARTLTQWVKGNDSWSMHVSNTKSQGLEPLETAEIKSAANPHLVATEEKLQTLVTAMRAINLDDPSIDYDRFVAIQRALCAVTCCNIDFLHETVWPWVCTQTVARGNGPRTEERGIEWLEAKWESFGTSAIGAEYVLRVAAAKPFNCKEAQDALFNEDIAALYGAVEEDDGVVTTGPQGSAVDENSDQLPPPGPQAPNPIAAGHTDIALRDDFIQRYGNEFRFIPERGTRDGWHMLEDGLWVPRYPEFADKVSGLCSERGDFYRPQGRGGQQIDIKLKGAGTHGRVEQMLNKSPCMVAPIALFDRDPYLLNTPQFVVDLRTMQMVPHNASHLFRLRTLVSPDYGVFGPPERWLKIIDHMSIGRPWLPLALKLWFGYGLTGLTNWELMLMIWGYSGTGKSLLVEVINAIIGTYGKIKAESWFTTGHNAENRFDMDDIEGLRQIFGDETTAGSRFNETRLSKVISGGELDVEQKNVRGKKPVKPQAKITINGNHRLSLPVGDRTGGLARRLMVLEMKAEHVTPPELQDPDLKRVLIEEEGPQILTWLLQGAYEALEKGVHHFRAVAAPLFEEAEKYIAEADPHRQWTLNAGIVPGDPNKDYIRLRDAYNHYMAYRREEDPRARETMKTFKTAMEPLKWHWEDVHRGEPDVNKHKVQAAYGWKFSDDPTQDG